MKFIEPIERFVEALTIVWLIDLILKAPGYVRRRMQRDRQVNQA